MHPNLFENRSRQRSKGRTNSQDTFSLKSIQHTFKKNLNLIQKTIRETIFRKYAQPHESAAPAIQIKGPGLSKTIQNNLGKQPQKTLNFKCRFPFIFCWFLKSFKVPFGFLFWSQIQLKMALKISYFFLSIFGSLWVPFRFPFRSQNCLKPLGSFLAPIRLPKSLKKSTRAAPAWATRNPRNLPAPTGSHRATKIKIVMKIAMKLQGDCNGTITKPLRYSDEVSRNCREIAKLVTELLRNTRNWNDIVPELYIYKKWPDKVQARRLLKINTASTAR